MSMIEPGRILPMYGPLLGGRHLAETAGRESLTVDEMAARLLNELGEDGRALQGLSRVLARAHQLRCAAAPSLWAPRSRWTRLSAATYACPARSSGTTASRLRPVAPTTVWGWPMGWSTWCESLPPTATRRRPARSSPS